MNFSTDATSTNKEKMDANILSMLVGVMTPGQIAIAPYVGLALLINNAKSTTVEKVDGHFALGNVDATLEILKQTEAVSVYLGVDRTIFNDGDFKTVAITDAAIREGINNETFGVAAEYNEPISTAARVALITTASVCAAAAIGCITYAVKTWNTAQKLNGTIFTLCNKKTGEIFECSALDPKTWVMQQDKENYAILFESVADPLDGNQAPVTFYTTTGTKVTAAVGVIFAAAAIALAIYTFVQSIKEPEREKVDYTDIPRAIIDVKRETDGQSQYFAYYAARLAGASDDYQNEKDTTKLYGDLNGLNGYEKWLCLYYAKDLRIGSPLTPNILIKTTGKLSTLQINSGYVPIHDFFNNTLVANNTGYTAINLNTISTNKDAAKIYVYLKRDLDVKPLTASIIDNTSTFNWLAVIAFLGGAALATGATVLVYKRKKKGKAEA